MPQKPKQSNPVLADDLGGPSPRVRLPKRRTSGALSKAVDRVQEVQKEFIESKHPRGPGGRWIHIGITPNTKMYDTFAEAKLALSSPEFQKKSKAMTKSLADQIQNSADSTGRVGVDHQVGMWEGKFEPSLRVRADRVNPHKAHALAKRESLKYDQEGIISFEPHRGEDRSVLLEGINNPQKIGQQLVEAGIPGSSFHPSGKSVSVYLGADQRQELKKLRQLAKRNRLRTFEQRGKIRY